jgi:hypothetical protein
MVGAAMVKNAKLAKVIVLIGRLSAVIGICALPEIARA